MVDNISYVQGLAQALVIIHCPHISIASLTKGWGVTEGPIGLPALQPVTCLWVLRGQRGPWVPYI